MKKTDPLVPTPPVDASAPAHRAEGSVRSTASSRSGGSRHSANPCGCGVLRSGTLFRRALGRMRYRRAEQAFRSEAGAMALRLVGPLAEEIKARESAVPAAEHGCSERFRSLSGTPQAQTARELHGELRRLDGLLETMRRNVPADLEPELWLHVGVYDRLGEALGYCCADLHRDESRHR